MIARNGLSDIAAQNYGESDSPSVSTGIGSFGKAIGSFQKSVDSYDGGYPQNKVTEKISDYGIKKGLGLIGVPGRTAYGLLDDAEDAKFDPSKTSLNVAKDVAEFGLGLTDPLSMAGIDTAHSLATDGFRSAAKTASDFGFSMLGGIVGYGLGGPLGAKAGQIAGKALSNAAFESYDDGAIGDAFNARTNEVARDNLEDSGYSYSESQDATSGSTNARGTGGTPSESAAKEMGRASGLGRQSYGGYNDGGYGDSGGDSGAHDSMGGLGGAGDRDSSPGGMGGV